MIITLYTFKIREINSSHITGSIIFTCVIEYVVTGTYMCL
jgi:hypothetical protein